MKKSIKKQFTKMMSLMLVAVMSVALAACGTKEAPADEVAVVEEVSEAVVEETVDASVEETAQAEEAVEEEAEEVEAQVVEATEVGEGATQFTFEVVDSEGTTTLFTVNTDKTTVGEALLDVDLIAGEDSEYGLYVKTVNGIVADYDVDQTYWAFYIDGEYAMTGVDATEVVAGSTYSFKVEK